MSTNTTSTSLFAAWVTNVISNPNANLGSWVHFDAVFCHFCSFSWVTEMTNVSFKRKMNIICNRVRVRVLVLCLYFVSKSYEDNVLSREQWCVKSLY